jgi:RNA recognition motif-containing protein
MSALNFGLNFGASTQFLSEDISKSILPPSQQQASNIPLPSQESVNPIHTLNVAETALFVGNLSFFCKEDDLQTLFVPFGSVASINIRRNWHGRSLLYGYVIFQRPDQSLAAMHALNGREFIGRRIR